MKKKLVFLFLFLIIAGLSFSFASAQEFTAKEPGWQGIVPCGRNSGANGETTQCTLCHLVLGIQRIIQYGLYIVIAFAFAGIFIAGVMYVISSGNEGMITQAKGFLSASLIGFAVVLGAWIIVNTTLWIIGSNKYDPGNGLVAETWWRFSCSTTNAPRIGGSDGTGKCCVSGPGKCSHIVDASLCTNGTLYEQSCDTIKQCVADWSNDTCGNEGKGSCYDASFRGVDGTARCPDGTEWLAGGKDCKAGYRCCTGATKEGERCSKNIVNNGYAACLKTCNSLAYAEGRNGFTGLLNDPDVNYPSCGSGLKCCWDANLDKIKSTPCGNKNKGFCFAYGSRSPLDPCEDGYSWLSGGEVSCPISYRCCVKGLSIGEVCDLGRSGTCKSENTSCIQVDAGTDNPRCGTGLKCCKP